MQMNLHIATLAIVTVGIGWVMLRAGVQKNALEWRQLRRICPSCGQEIHACFCAHCAS